MEEIKYCLCGCHEEVKNTNPNVKFIRGHVKRLSKQEPPLCKCGCGQPTKFSFWDSKWNDYINGHTFINKSEEHIKKIADSRRGFKMSEEAKHKIGDANRGRKHTEEAKEKIRLATTGENNPFYGKSHSEETKKKISDMKIGVPVWNGGGENHWGYGKKLSDEHKKKIGEAGVGRKQSEETKKKRAESNRGKKRSKETKKKLSEKAKRRFGEKNPNWKGGVQPLNQKIRNCEKSQDWRIKTFERDDYTCQGCKKRGGGTLHAHHKKLFNQILKDNNIQTLEEALACQELWDLDNGITLCKKCHKKEHKGQPRDKAGRFLKGTVYPKQNIGVTA